MFDRVLMRVLRNLFFACSSCPASTGWSHLKAEVLEARDWSVFADLDDAQASFVEYFDYYNHDRRHSSIGYLKLYQFHQRRLNNIIQFSPS